VGKLPQTLRLVLRLYKIQVYQSPVVRSMTKVFNPTSKLQRMTMRLNTGILTSANRFIAYQPLARLTIRTCLISNPSGIGRCKRILTHPSWQLQTSLITNWKLLKQERPHSSWFLNLRKPRLFPHSNEGFLLQTLAAIPENRGLAPLTPVSNLHCEAWVTLGHPSHDVLV